MDLMYNIINDVQNYKFNLGVEMTLNAQFVSTNHDMNRDYMFWRTTLKIKMDTFRIDLSPSLCHKLLVTYHLYTLLDHP